MNDAIPNDVVPNDSAPAESFRWEATWCVVEVMGHNQYAGLVTEQVIAGSAFLRVDVPECDDRPAYTKLLGGASIYAITPCSEAVAREAVRRFRSRPIAAFDFGPEASRPPLLEDWEN